MSELQRLRSMYILLSYNVCFKIASVILSITDMNLVALLDICDMVPVSRCLKYELLIVYPVFTVEIVIDIVNISFCTT